MDTNHKKACFEFLRLGRGEIFERPETWSTSTRYYLSLLEEKYPQDMFFSWNWPAFFFIPYWALYRKMVLFGILAFILLPMFWPLGHLVGGAIANPLYLYFVRRKVAIGRTQKSSTSWLYPMIALFMSFLLIAGFLAVVIIAAPFKN